MNIETAQIGSHWVIRILDDLTLTSSCPELGDMVDKALLEGQRNIVLSFTEDSYLSSRSVSVLVACLESIKERGGRLSIIRPNASIRHLLTIIDLESVITVIESEESLSPEYPAPHSNT